MVISLKAMVANTHVSKKIEFYIYILSDTSYINSDNRRSVQSMFIL